jgi:hypothetical protein
MVVFMKTSAIKGFLLRFLVITAIRMEINVLWDLMACRVIERSTDVLRDCNAFFFHL